VKTGRSLTEIAQELERQVNTRKDYLAPQGAIEAKVRPVITTLSGAPDAVVDGEILAQGEQAPAQEVVLDGFNGQALKINNFAHSQLGDYLGIPAKYYTRMREEDPELLAFNINRWLHKDPNNKRLVRALDGRVRGFLSPKFRPLDNFQLASAVFPTLQANNVKILSAELTETRFYIKGILPDLSDPLPEGLVWGSGHTNISQVVKGFQLPEDQNRFLPQGGRGRVVAAIVISNSDVGAGTLRVEPSLFTTWCTNLAIMVRAAMKKYHVGRAWEADDNFEVFTDETRAKDDEAFFLKVRDVTKAAFTRETFDGALNQIKAAGTKQIESPKLDKVVEVAVKQLALPVGTQGDILSFLSRGGDLSQWGLSSAITAVANKPDVSYELATQLEYAGGQVLALDGKPWDAIANAA